MHFLLIFTSEKQIMSCKHVAQSIILKSVLFRNLMQAFTMYFVSISQIIILSKMHAVDQKHNYQLEWPYACPTTCKGITTGFHLGPGLYWMRLLGNTIAVTIKNKQDYSREIALLQVHHTFHFCIHFFFITHERVSIHEQMGCTPSKVTSPLFNLKSKSEF